MISWTRSSRLNHSLSFSLSLRCRGSSRPWIEALAALRSADAGERQRAVDWLISQKVDPLRQHEVLTALDPLLRDMDALVRLKAQHAKFRWSLKR